MTREDIFYAIGEADEVYLTGCSKVIAPAARSDRAGGKYFRVILVAAIVAFLLATTAFAYTGFVVYENPRAMLEAFFGKISAPHGVDCLCSACVPVLTPTFERVPLDKEAAQSYILEHLVTVGKSVVNERSSHRLTVDGYIYDSVNSCGVVQYTLERYGEILTPYSYTLQYDGEITGIPSRINHPSKKYLIADQSTDTCLKIVAYYVVPYGASPMLKLGFEGMIYKDSDIAAETYVTIPLEGKDLPYLSLATGAITLSPIGIHISASLPDLQRADTNYVEIMISQLAIRYDDGTQYLIEYDDPDNMTENFSYALKDIEEYPGITYVFNRVVDIGKVEAVVVNGTAYPLTQ